MGEEYTKTTIFTHVLLKFTYLRTVHTTFPKIDRQLCPIYLVNVLVGTVGRLSVGGGGVGVVSAGGGVACSLSALSGPLLLLLTPIPGALAADAAHEGQDCKKIRGLVKCPLKSFAF